MANFSIHPGQVFRYSQWRDTFMRYLTDSPTPAKFASLLKQVDNGDIAALCEMQLEMERKNAWLQGVASTRRRAVTALDWSIEPEEELSDDSSAKEAADYCFQTLKAIPSWKRALAYLSTAIGPNVAVVEVIWSRATPIDFVEIPGHRLTSHWQKHCGVFIVTDEEPLGVSTEVFGKFIVHHPESQGGFPLRKTLTHATCLPYLSMSFGQKDWQAFNELYGIPLRIAKAENAAVDFDRDEVQEALEQIGSDAAMTLPPGVNIEFLQATGKGDTFVSMMEWAETTLSILWLGQNLTTNISDSGSRAAAEVHDSIRMDVLAADMQAEADSIREQLLTPMTRLRFPGKQVPVPIFKRKMEKVRNIEAERLAMEKLSFMSSAGLRVDPEQIYHMMDIPMPTTGPLEIEPRTEQEEDDDTENTGDTDRRTRRV